MVLVTVVFVVVVVGCVVTLLVELVCVEIGRPSCGVGVEISVVAFSLEVKAVYAAVTVLVTVAFVVGLSVLVLRFV